MASALELRIMSILQHPWKANIYQSVVQNLAANSSSTQLVNYDTVGADPVSSFSVSTHLYSCPVDGWYHVDAAVTLAGIGTSTTQVFIAILKNGAEIRRGVSAPLTGTFPVRTVSSLIKCVTGDTLSVGLYLDGSAAVATQPTATTCYLDIFWQGPS